jgi:hypothetical protein
MPYPDTHPRTLQENVFWFNFQIAASCLQSVLLNQ